MKNASIFAIPTTIMLVAGLTLTGTACSDPPQVELDEEDGGAQDSLQTDGPNFTGADTGSGDDDSGKTGGDSFVTLTFEVRQRQQEIRRRRHLLDRLV